MLVIYFMSVLGFVYGESWTNPVNTTSGLVRGIVKDNFSVYLGIPYAKVNEGNPFGIPFAQPYMDGVFDAVDDSVVCPQEEEYNHTLVGSLDCLHLNVYVPHTASLNNNLPVLMYFYGGRFMFGFSNDFVYDPRFLVQHDIIFVIFNYRVGPYGFMCLDIEEVPGNQGLRDQYLALQWVNKNIQAFGGDAERVTVMGNSAGSMSADLHLLSKYPKLYNQIILQSGTGLVPGTVSPTDNTIPLKIAEHLGYTTNDINEALQFLANTHTDLVVAASIDLNIAFGPCVEKEFNNVERLVHVHPVFNDLDTIDNNISILGGFNSHEAIMLNNVDDMYFHSNLETEFIINDMNTMINKVRRFYNSDDLITEEDENVIDNLCDFQSDFKFNHPIQRTLAKYANKGLQVFQYVFSYTGNRNYVSSRMENVNIRGAAHADELGYLFAMELFPETPTPEDQLIIDRMTTLWTNFVKFGDPTPSTSQLIPVICPPVTEDVISYLDINTELTVSRRPYHTRMSFWDLFYAANEDKLLAQNTSSSSGLSSSVLLFFFHVLIYVLQL